MQFGELLVASRRRDSAAPSWEEDLQLIHEVSPRLAETSTGIRARPAGAQAPSPRITAVILTCDEEETVGHCIEALAADVDDVLVIDSGSQDDTLRIVRETSLPTRVIQSPWADDFALQRNVAFDHVTEGWIVMVDADEILDPASSGDLRRCLSALDTVVPQSDLVVCPHITDVNDSGGVYRDLPRALRAGTALRYRGRIHERPYDQDGNQPPTAFAGIHFTHHGYRPEVIESKEKLRRHSRLLDICRGEEPHNPKWLFYQTRAELIDNLDPARAHALFTALAASLSGLPADSADYIAERREDSWALLCELALRFGGAAEIAQYAPLLRSARRAAEATYFEVVVSASQTLNHLSRLADSAAAAARGEGRRTARETGRLHELHGLLALASGRYEHTLSALHDATAWGSGAKLASEITALRTMLSHAGSPPPAVPSA
ncbi:glycosyltransferase [Streptomyces sp. NBRC 110611]|uniref:glycosyltransferase n=1 Tax=Streptomyces sp. NBRC 110611 TaxID=1621259 RepID=UPI0008556919|nr:glycosyltransferase [Streptomyces sp. NBRC 110611]GAU67996.1 glycosyltransferase [Streptomyces sp. NBRC 110611]